MRQGVKMDGEYYLKVKSRILQVRFDLSALCPHTSRINLPPHAYLHTQGALTSCVNVFQIYCAEMQTDSPKEYVTLRSGQTDNYSEVYGNRCVR